jgi:hypothetical protein
MGKERDISGIGMGFGQSEYLEFFNAIFMSVLLWTSITVEAFLRQDFGERYYTKGNFFVGFWFLALFGLFGMLGIGLGFITIGGGGIAPSFGVIWVGYMLFSAFHFWKIFVNNHIGNPPHSLYSGTPRLEPLGKIILKIINPLLGKSALFFGKITLNSDNYQRFSKSLEVRPPLHNSRSFTTMWLEPLVVFLVTFFLLDGLVFFWGFLAGIALTVLNHIAAAQDRSEELDMLDSVQVAAFQKDDHEARKNIRYQMKESLDIVKERIKEEPEYLETLKEESPSFFEALEELDIDLGAEAES